MRVGAGFGVRVRVRVRIRVRARVGFVWWRLPLLLRWPPPLLCRESLLCWGISMRSTAGDTALLASLLKPPALAVRFA